jgi:hypothetical protein
LEEPRKGLSLRSTPIAKLPKRQAEVELAWARIQLQERHGGDWDAIG